MESLVGLNTFLAQASFGDTILWGTDVSGVAYIQSNIYTAIIGMCNP